MLDGILTDLLASMPARIALLIYAPYGKLQRTAHDRIIGKGRRQTTRHTQVAYLMRSVDLYFIECSTAVILFSSDVRIFLNLQMEEVEVELPRSSPILRI